MERAKLKPKPGLKIQFPDQNRFLPDEGEEVELTTYWRRRILSGDVVRIPQPKTGKPQAEG